MSHEVPDVKPEKTDHEISEQIRRIHKKLGERATHVVIPENGAWKSSFGDRTTVERWGNPHEGTETVHKLAKGTYSSGNEFIRAQHDSYHDSTTAHTVKEQPDGGLVLETNVNHGKAVRVVEVSPTNSIKGVAERNLLRKDEQMRPMSKEEIISSSAKSLGGIRSEIAAQQIARSPENSERAA